MLRYEVMDIIGNYIIYNRGLDYFDRGRVGEFRYEGNNHFSVDVRGSKKYKVSIKTNKEGAPMQIGCSCPYNRGYCKHIAAALFAFDDDVLAMRNDISSASVGKLVRLMGCYAERESNLDIGEKIIIKPELTPTWEGLELSLSIGTPGSRMYVVKDISELVEDLNNGNTKRYGKFLTVENHWGLLSDYGRKLTELAFSAYRSGDNSYSSNYRRKFLLNHPWLERFFEISKDEKVLFNNNECDIKYENPEVKFRLEALENNMYRLTAVTKLKSFGTGWRGCLYDVVNHRFYMTEHDFAVTVGTVYMYLPESGEMNIEASDMTEFYNAVLKPLSEYAELEGKEYLDDYVPPELVSRLYLDVNEDGDITGHFEYSYEDKSYPLFYDNTDNPFCDHRGERKVETLILKYFDIGTFPQYNLLITGDDEIFDFVTEGINEISDIAEVYVSDSFNNLRVRQPAVPNVGIHPEGNLLALDITAEDYSPEELLELLGAYRRGRKYHRLRDGSFAVAGEGLEKLDELTKSLHITDKDFIKANIKIPQYRMLYLNSLQSDNESMRIERSRGFRQLIDRYEELLDSAKRAEVPPQLKGIMRPYQKQGFVWMKTIMSYGFGGILADDMGLGKTLQAISLILDAKREDSEARTLVVCPSSLTLNWESEIKKFAPGLKPLVVAGTSASREEQLCDFDKYDVIITSYQTLSRDIARYEDKEFKLHFIDEAQYIKNNKTQMAKAVKAVNSKIRFALTGTPVENSLAELWSIFDFIMPGYLFGYTYFSKTYEKNIVRKNDEAAVKSLQKLTAPFILRRIKKEVLKELPEKTETVLKAEMGKEQSGIYSANVLQVKQSSAFGKDGSKIEILAMLTRLRQLCCDPSLVYENYSGGSAKLELCMELVESCIESGHKLLLFSQFTSMLDIIAERFKAAGISYYMLTGSTPPKDRLRMVNSFNSDKTNVFLISLKAGGTGLNLTGADIVVHYDPWWNASAENQASDRAHRIGQKNKVQIYKLIAGKTIEEKIIELQEKKLAIADMALNGEGDIMKMSVEDIMSILE